MKKHKELNIFSISLQNIKHRAFRNGFMIFFVFLQTFALFFSTMLMMNMERGIINTTERMGAEVIVVPNKNSKELQESLFMGKPCTIYFDRQWVNKLKGVKGVNKISPQLYLATLEAACCEAAVQLIAIDPETDFLIEPWLKTQGDLELKKGQVVVGHDVIAKVGEKVTFYNTEFQVAAKLSKTSMGYDNSVFMSFDTVFELANSKSANNNLKLDNSENLISMIAIDAEEGYSPDKLAVEIQHVYNDDDIAVHTANSLFSGIAAELKKFTSYSSVLIVILFIATAMALISIFTITINERKREFGILYTLGANGRQIFSMIIIEALIISIIGGVLGVLVSEGLLLLFKNFIGMSFGIPYFEMTFTEVLLVSSKCMLVSVLTGFIASFYSAYKISKEEPYALIRENE
ncbi:ABC transporter permease [Clostridium tagluense]|uniref:ABC transporter permease n=1 Tax=Clostridium tagluense TaxID=360422 RepID=UPI001C6E022C|nr:FtsX-like permease family protein [Clostridium tagluense]MBW9158196.1 FtsX-like permease family protein [Clostridium tagluense]WLC67518.1 FtsX-like permease family protein [Clostridium tagluense]